MAKASKRQRLIKSSSSEKNATEGRAPLESDSSAVAGYRQSGGHPAPAFAIAWRAAWQAVWLYLAALPGCHAWLGSARLAASACLALPGWLCLAGFLAGSAYPELPNWSCLAGIASLGAALAAKRKTPQARRFASGLA